MEKSSSDIVKVLVRKTPLLFSKQYLYELSDFVYGEWLIFDGFQPRYYLDIFDSRYERYVDILRPNAELWLSSKFKSVGLNLSFRTPFFKIPLRSRSKIEEVTLDKLPVKFLQTE